MNDKMKRFLLFKIEEFPALYRQDHPYYKEKTTTHRNAWEDILSAMKEKYGEELIEHSLHTVTDLMATFSSLKAKLVQVEKAHKTKTGMAASEVRPIQWPFYHDMEFIRQTSEPLPTQSSLDPLGSDKTPQSSSSGPKWNPRQEKQRRSIAAKAKREWAVTAAEERRTKVSKFSLAAVTRLPHWDANRLGISKSV